MLIFVFSFAFRPFAPHPWLYHLYHPFPIPDEFFLLFSICTFNSSFHLIFFSVWTFSFPLLLTLFPFPHLLAMLSVYHLFPFLNSFLFISVLMCTHTFPFLFSVVSSYHPRLSFSSFSSVFQVNITSLLSSLILSSHSPLLFSTSYPVLHLLLYFSSFPCLAFIHSSGFLVLPPCTESRGTGGGGEWDPGPERGSCRGHGRGHSAHAAAAHVPAAASVAQQSLLPDGPRLLGPASGLHQD